MKVTQMNPSSAPRPLSPSAHATPSSHSSPAARKMFDIKSFSSDDWILLAIIAALVLEGSDDYILLCALGYLFLAGF